MLCLTKMSENKKIIETQYKNYRLIEKKFISWGIWYIPERYNDPEQGWNWEWHPYWITNPDWKSWKWFFQDKNDAIEFCKKQYLEDKKQSKKMIDWEKLLEFLDNFINKNRFHLSSSEKWNTTKFILETCINNWEMIKQKILSMMKENE